MDSNIIFEPSLFVLAIMIIAAQQPYYLPDFLYFYKIYHSDLFLIADHLRFRKQSPMVRTKIIVQNSIKYLTIPVRHIGRDPHRFLRDIKFADEENWKNQHLKTIRSLYQKLPYFEHYYPELEEIYRNVHVFLCEFLVRIIQWHLHYVMPHKKVLRATTQDIREQAELYRWIKNLEDPQWLIFSSERNYYRKHFPDIKRLELNLGGVNQFPSGFHPSLPLMVLLFIKGPETVQFFKIQC